MNYAALLQRLKSSFSKKNQKIDSFELIEETNQALQLNTCQKSAKRSGSTSINKAIFCFKLIKLLLEEFENLSKRSSELSSKNFPENFHSQLVQISCSAFALCYISKEDLVKAQGKGHLEALDIHRMNLKLIQILLEMDRFGDQILKPFMILFKNLNSHFALNNEDDTLEIWSVIEFDKIHIKASPLVISSYVTLLKYFCKKQSDDYREFDRFFNRSDHEIYKWLCALDGTETARFSDTIWRILCKISSCQTSDNAFNTRRMAVKYCLKCKRKDAAKMIKYMVQFASSYATSSTKCFNLTAFHEYYKQIYACSTNQTIDSSLESALLMAINHHTAILQKFEKFAEISEAISILEQILINESSFLEIFRLIAELRPGDTISESTLLCAKSLQSFTIQDSANEDFFCKVLLRFISVLETRWKTGKLDWILENGELLFLSKFITRSFQLVSEMKSKADYIDLQIKLRSLSLRIENRVSFEQIMQTFKPVFEILNNSSASDSKILLSQQFYNFTVHHLRKESFLDAFYLGMECTKYYASTNLPDKDRFLKRLDSVMNCFKNINVSNSVLIAFIKNLMESGVFECDDSILYMCLRKYARVARSDDFFLRGNLKAEVFLYEAACLERHDIELKLLADVKNHIMQSDNLDYRLRTMNNSFLRERVQETFCVKTVKNTFKKFLENDYKLKDSETSQSKLLNVSNAYCWMAILSIDDGEDPSEYMKKSMEFMRKILALNAPDITWEWIVTINSIKFLAPVFGLCGLFEHEITCYSILNQINQLVSPTWVSHWVSLESTDLIFSSQSISYVKVGDIRAARSPLAENENDERQGLLCSLARSLVEAFSGNIEASEKLLEKSKEVFEMAKYSKLEAYIGISQACFIKSLISHISGISGAALLEALQCCEILTKIINSLTRDQNQGHSAYSILISHQPVGSDFPRILNLYLNCLSNLGSLFRSRGSFSEAEYFWEKGRDISRQYCISYYKSLFDWQLVDLLHTCNKIDPNSEWENFVNIDCDELIKSYGKFPKELAWISLKKADMLLRDKKFENADKFVGNILCVLEGSDSKGVAFHDIVLCLYAKQAFARTCLGNQSYSGPVIKAEFPLHEEKVDAAVTKTCVDYKILEPEDSNDIVKYSKSTQKSIKIEDIQTEINSIMSELEESQLLSFLCLSPDSFYSTSLMRCNSLYQLSSEFGDEILNIQSASSALTIRREIIFHIREKLGLNPRLTDKISWPSFDYSVPSNHEATQGNLESYWEKIYHIYSSESGSGFDDWETLKSLLPENWNVICLNFDADNDIFYASNFDKSGDSISLSLPLSRWHKTALSFQEIDKEFGDIIKESDKVAREANFCQTKFQKTEWWEKRRLLDSRLEKVLYNLELVVFGGFKGILDCNQRSSMLETGAKISSILRKVIPKTLNGDYDDTILGLAHGIEQSDDLIIYEDFVDGILESKSKKITMATKKRLIGRITDAVPCKRQYSSNRHLVLILGGNIQHLPWENIPSLRNMSVSRLPCLSMLRDRLLLSQNLEGFDLVLDRPTGLLGVDKNNLGYVLNPSSDLKKTEERIKPILKHETWKGVIGNPPSEPELLCMLENKNIYAYFGHGSGESFVKGSHIRRLKKCATCLLLGCSSGELKRQGKFDPRGPVLDYLVAGSPAVLANLWDVTDGDIDRFSINMMENWGLIDSEKKDKISEDLSRAILESRSSCKLRYLTGASPVLYGLPVIIDKDR